MLRRLQLINGCKVAGRAEAGQGRVATKAARGVGKGQGRDKGGQRATGRVGRLLQVQRLQVEVCFFLPWLLA